MKNALLWYVPQTAIFCWAVYIGVNIDPPISGGAIVGGGVLFAAAYTGGVNLVLDIRARLAQRRLSRHNGPRELG